MTKKGDISNYHVTFSINVVLNNITLLWFLLFSMCDSLPITCINFGFFTFIN